MTIKENEALDRAKHAALETLNEEALTFLSSNPQPWALVGWLLHRLGAAWEITLTSLARNDQWQLRIASRPSEWDESFSYTYRGSLQSVVARAYAGEHDDGEVAS